jgi:hypothetical protein
MIMGALDELEPQIHHEWSVESLLDAIQGCLPSEDSNTLLRVILIYARSNCIPQCDPQRMTEFYTKNPLCYIDLVYLHEKPSEENCVQDIFDTLGHIESKDSRSYEITRNYKRYLLAMTELLGNPSQRSNQPKCHHWDFHQ